MFGCLQVNQERLRTPLGLSLPHRHNRRVDFNLVRIGLNHRFNSPIVAKY